MKFLKKKSGNQTKLENTRFCLFKITKEIVLIGVVVKQGFFLIAPLKEVEKAIASPNKTTQKSIIKNHIRPFFCFSSATHEYLA